MAVETTQPPPPEITHADERPIVRSLTSWDGNRHIGIATHGYRGMVDGYPDRATYPGYPALIRAIMPLTGDDARVAALLASNLAFLLALIALFALSVRHVDPGRAVLSLWFLALAPGAGAFALSYSESLFLLLSVSAFLAVETRHDWLGGIAIALATITRVPGILLVLPLLMLIIDRDGRRPSPAWVPLLLAPLALGGLFGYHWWSSGDFLASVSAQSSWAALPAPADGPDLTWLAMIVTALYMGILLAYVFLFVYFRHDRIRPAYWAVAIISVASVFFAGRWLSAPRYLAVGWPFDWVLASRRSRIGTVVVLVTFATLQVLFLWLAFAWLLAP